MKLRTALLFQAGNYVGREYLGVLRAAGITPDMVATVGRMPEASIARERQRTAGRWNPPPLDALLDAPNAVAHYESLADPELWQRIGDAGIDIAIQGGIGILKPDMLAAPRIGFVNVHPGRLPAYKGNTCPEWALFNGDDIYATAHIIDAGIDTGPIICEGRYAVSDDWDYFDLRANLYAHCAHVLVTALEILDAAADDPDRVLTVQDPDAGQYWQPIPDDKLATVISGLPRGEA